MKIITAFITIFFLGIANHQANSTVYKIPFTSQPPHSAASIITIPTKIISFKGNLDKQKVLLNWVVSENETTDQFEVEKSIDGKTFTMVALVFGTDKTDTDNYQFYEKAGSTKMHYRIKAISKTRETEYSSVIEINPIN